MTNPVTLPLTIMSAIPLLAGGALHLRDWSNTYRAVPWEVPGAWVVRAGFPVTFLVSVVLAVVLVAAAAKRWPALRYAVAAGIGFQVSSIAALVLSREANVFGWVEPVWSVEARQVLAVEILTIVGLVAVAVTIATSRKSTGQKGGAARVQVA